MRNTRRRYILIFPEVLINPTRMLLMTGPKSVSHYPPSAWRLEFFLYYRKFSASVRHPPHDYRYMNIVRLSYADFTTILRLNTLGLLGTLF